MNYMLKLPIYLVKDKDLFISLNKGAWGHHTKLKTTAWDRQIWHRTYGRPIHLWTHSQGLMNYLEVSQKALDTTVEASDCSDSLADYNRSSNTSLLFDYI